MKFDLLRKLVKPDALHSLRAKLADQNQTVVLCHGCFDIVHPGHVRYLQYARQQGDTLVVSLTGDDAIEKADGMRPYMPQELRAESLAALEFVDHVIIADDPTAQPIIQTLKPDIYIKGKEYEHSADPRFIQEKKLVESLGGRVLFSSGEVVFSSTAILQTLSDALETDTGEEARRLAACCQRWSISLPSIQHTTTSDFANKRVAIIGDAMIDRYIRCDNNTDVASEAPILSVKPIGEDNYLGGAAIIAAHLAALGAKPHLFTTVGTDQSSAELLDALNTQNIHHTALPTRKRLPQKERYLVDKQKVLKVDRATPLPLDSKAQNKIIAAVDDIKHELDAVIFTDFGYGSVTIPLLQKLIPILRPHVQIMVGDVSGPRRTLLAMRDFDLLTPTEREMRAVLGDFDQSLPSVAAQLMGELGVPNLAVTMGTKGAVLFHPRETKREKWFSARLRSEYLPSLSRHDIDPVGAGDAFLAAATLMLTTGATFPQTGYLGSAAAAVAVSRIGNRPVHRDELHAFLAARPEMRAASNSSKIAVSG